MSVSTVKAIINGQVYNLSYNATSGKWEASITAPSVTSWNETDHKYGVTIEATDMAGNVTTKDRADPTLGSALQLRVLEKTKPNLILTSPSVSAVITNPKPPIVFQLRDIDSGVNVTSLQLKIDGGVAIGSGASGMTCTSVAGGYDCTYVPENSLSDGSHTITISIADNDGNVSNLLSSTFSIDTVPPALNVISPIQGLITNNATIVVEGTTNDSISSPVAISIKANGVDQGSVSLIGDTFNKTITITEGTNIVEINATDSVGLVSTITRNVTLDTVAPTITGVTISPNPIDGGQTVTITVTVID